MLGLAEGTVVLVEHHPGWGQAFYMEAQRIRAALGALAADVQHCGSTAVPGLRAKPILDMVVGVVSPELLQPCLRALQDIGYDHHGDRIVPGGHFLTLGAPRTHHLHLVPWRSPAWEEKIAFRDRLRADRVLAQGYEATKLALAGRFAADRAAYTRGKAAFIEAALRGATVPGGPG